MKHPFEALRAEYERDLGQMRITRMAAVDSVSRRLLQFYGEGRYESVSRVTGVPQVWMATSFQREASSDFRRSPAQGDFWNAVSRNVPAGRGPFASWAAAAIDAYQINGLQKVGVANWTWPLACYYGELFNGFGYRDYRAMRSPYLWGGTNLQQLGKYTSDGDFDPGTMDAQLGIVPVMMRMAQLEPALRLPGPWPFALGPATVPAVPPIKTPIAAIAADDGGDATVRAVQEALNARGYGPLKADGNFGRQTSLMLRAFEIQNRLVADGLLDDKTIAALGVKVA